MKLTIPLGDVVDKISILLIKRAKLKDLLSIKNVNEELRYLSDEWLIEKGVSHTKLPEWEELYQVNKRLWEVEDRMREHENIKLFGNDFIQDARSVYMLNDKRAELKRSINISLNSRFIEEKSY